MFILDLLYLPSLNLESLKRGYSLSLCILVNILAVLIGLSSFHIFPTHTIYLSQCGFNMTDQANDLCFQCVIPPRNLRDTRWRHPSYMGSFLVVFDFFHDRH